LDGDEDGCGASDFAHVSSVSVISSGAIVAPAGKLFEETMQHLGPLERHLLFFSASSSLAAVRWLIRLGASCEACDLNGSTCLHAACRSGGLPVVSKFAKHANLLESADLAMWTPLHIASHMGRRKVVVQLMRAKANPLRRTGAGQSAMDLCTDGATRELLLDLHSQAWSLAPAAPWPSQAPGVGRRRLLVAQVACSTASGHEALPALLDGGGHSHSEFAEEVLLGSRVVSRTASRASPDRVTGLVDESEVADIEVSDEDDDLIGVPARCEPELFFVTPSPVIQNVGLHSPSATMLGIRIFNLCPSYGIAFMVVAGLAGNYTAALTILLRHKELDRGQVGELLGQSLSVCHLMRFGLLDSFPLMSTGVVEALTVAFRHFPMPGDLEKIQRLVHCVALVWWRKHNMLLPDDMEVIDLTAAAHFPSSQSSSVELAGLVLFRCIGSVEALSQLMLSTVMLHWFLHGDMEFPEPNRRMSFAEWMQLNAGFDEAGGAFTERLQLPIYAKVAMRPIPELRIASRFLAGQEAGLRAEEAPTAPAGVASDDEHEVDIDEAWRYVGDHSTLRVQPTIGGRAEPDGAAVTMKGWLQVLGGVLPSPAKANAASDGALGELTMSPVPVGSAAIASAFAQESGGDEVVVPFSGDGVTFATLSSIFLLFAVAPSTSRCLKRPASAEAAAAAAPYAVVDARHLRVVDAAEAIHTLTLEGVALDGEGCEAVSPISVTLLLPDARWKELKLRQLTLKAPSAQAMAEWRESLELTRSHACCFKI